MKKGRLLCVCIIALCIVGSAFSSTQALAVTTSSATQTRAKQADIDTDARLNAVGALVIGVAAVIVGGYELKRQSGQRGMSHDILEIEPSLSQEFEPLFYDVQDAWADNDQRRLAELMTPTFFEKRKQLLDQWQIAGKKACHEGMVIINLRQERNVKTAPRVVVTAQGRQYFSYPDRSQRFNREQYEQTYFHRFTEVWELNRDDAGQLRVTQIKTTD